MTLILQNDLPDAQRGPSRLPGIAPCAPDDWLRVDEAYAAQMGYRAALLAERREDVIWCDPAAMSAAQEVLKEALMLLPGLGFRVDGSAVHRPDGQRIKVDFDAPLNTLGQLVQEDICILEKRGDQHVLTGAVVCFPANWRLADKVGRPLTDIHVPVEDYDTDIARRVQRLFDGVQAGRPLWRFNKLQYRNPDLHQPRRITDVDDGTFVRSERQCIVRMPQSQAVVFSIHTWVVRGAEPPPAV
ncbi:DUF3445 domain-containing protein [Sulfitobacter sp. TSTF-M16]|uniref:DUF3445 domain-containing protein n=1 Tax=Sulfitobacter aestuariivivens TaxID=2766981 RepID=A0A927D514_9RHOB|nr:DUF3445 domain-containing protein [Sulfitobacter aestuariivivens]MBD3664506.1 DUF3445 domain-containing protein [Sulfitobacter aestuariivivens]